MDVNRTKEFYRNYPYYLCDCDYCKLFYSNIRAAYPDLADFLSTLGVEIEKPLELAWHTLDKEKRVMYAPAEYIILGTADGFEKTYIGNISIREALSHPPTKVEEEFFVIEVETIYLDNTLKCIS